MKKSILILAVSLSFFIADLQSADSQINKKKAIEVIDLLQKYMDVFQQSQLSHYGLEVSDYKKVRLSIRIEGSSVDKTGLTENRIRTKAELRLRQAGLEPIPLSNAFDDELNIKIFAVGNAFTLSVNFSRLMLFCVNEKIYSAKGITWDYVGAGVHGFNSEYIVQSLDRCLDSFLNEYLKANVK